MTLEEILSPNSPENPPCPVCSLPLSDMEVRLNRLYHYDCNKCHICGTGPLAEGMVESALKKDLKPSHTTCYDRKMAEELRRKPVTITQELLDWHNERRLIFDINAQLTVNANQVMAATNFRNSRWIHELDLDSLFLVMKRLEAVAAEASIILDESKRKESVRKDRESKDKALLKNSSESRVTEQREKEIKRNRYTPGEKAIKAMMTCRLTRDEAVDEIVKQKIKGLLKAHADWTEEKAREFLDSEGDGTNGKVN